MIGSGEGSKPRRARLELGAGPASVAQARSFVSDMVRLWGCDDPMQVAALLTSEVVTNAVRHAADTVCVAVELEPDSVLMVQTRDDTPGEPVVRTASTDADSGRGMFLVDRLARRWGVLPVDDTGKVVWFEVPVAARRSEDRGAAEA